MEMLVFTLMNGPQQLGYFKFAVGHQAQAILEMMDFVDSIPCDQTGRELTIEEIQTVKKMGAVIPRTIVIDPRTCLQLLAAMDPHPELEEVEDPSNTYRGDLFEVQRSTIEGAVRAVRQYPDVHVILALMPIIPHMHGLGNPIPEDPLAP